MNKIVIFILILFLGVGESLHILSPQTLSPSSSTQPFFQIPSAVQKMPAWELLKALNLLELSPSSGVELKEKIKMEDESTLLRIQIPKPTTFPPVGLDILYSELGGTSSVDLLFNPEGYLIAIFPTPDSGVQKPYFFDLSYYYFEIPRPGSENETKKWNKFGELWEKDRRIILTYQRATKNFPPPINSGVSPFIYIGVDEDERIGYENIQTFQPNTFSLLNQSRITGKQHRLVLPIFPTVYSPITQLIEDVDYYNSLHKGEVHYHAETHHFDFETEEPILFTGPGSGFDVWLSSHKIKTPIYVTGVNPLEIANTKVMAQLAGLKIETKVHDNLTSETGEPVFKRQFGRIIWNMPAYFPHSSSPKRYDDFHDASFSKKDLERFIEGLYQMLSDKGIAFAWNIHTMEREEFLFGQHGFEIKAIPRRGDGEGEHVFFITWEEIWEPLTSQNRPSQKVKNSL